MESNNLPITLNWPKIFKYTANRLIAYPLVYKNWWIAYLYLFPITPSSQQTLILRNDTKCIIRNNRLDLASLDEQTVGHIYEKQPWPALGTKETIIDIGSSIGDFAILTKRKYPQNPLICYEPSNLANEIAHKNININTITNIKIIPSGLAAMTRNQTNTNTNRLMLDTRVNLLSAKTQLNNYRFKNGCGILKMDSEGYEYETIYSLDKKFIQSIKLLIIEWHTINSNDKRYNKSFLIAYLTKLGFTVTEYAAFMHNGVGTIYCANTNIKASTTSRKKLSKSES